MPASTVTLCRSFKAEDDFEAKSIAKAVNNKASKDYRKATITKGNQLTIESTKPRIFEYETYFEGIQPLSGDTGADHRIDFAVNPAIVAFVWGMCDVEDHNDVRNTGAFDPTRARVLAWRKLGND